MENITYLFGAGASCEVLPLVTDIPKDLQEFARKLEKYYRSQPTSEKSAALALILSKEYAWLSDACMRHSSIDTFAKKLFIKNEKQELYRLKLLLSLYFAYRQATSGIADKRYDSFFASIINDSIGQLPPIKILSWNYDSQFEISFNEFSALDDLGSNQDKLGVLSKHTRNLIARTGFSILKINGVTGFFDRGEDNLVDFYYGNPKINDIVGLTHFYDMFRSTPGVTSSIQSKLSFAWESEKQQDSIVDVAKASTQSTTVLVVVGYSFPFFNRKVDKILLNEGMPNLRKVYFQDPLAESVRERFLSIRDDIPIEKLVLRKDKSQFLIPDELTF